MAGYCKETDSVFLCPHGTQGETREVYGLRVTLPKKPARDKIYKRSTNKTYQYWERQPKPQGINPNTAKRFIDYIDGQFQYKRDGFWFYNNGKPEYITGAHWLLLQWGLTNVGYFDYRKAHRDLFYFLEASWVDERSFGTILTKTRRTGATYAAVAFMLAKGITMRRANLGMTSKTSDDAKEVFKKLIDMFNGLPFWFKPIHVMSQPKSVLEFRIPSQRTSKHKSENTQDTDIALNTTISHRATKEDSYDGFALRFYIGDEFSKWKKPEDILNHWEKIKRVFTDGGKIVGKAFLLSTIEYVNGEEDPYDKNADTGDKFRYLVHNSNVKYRNKLGRTKSGLYSIFISALDNFGGFIDRYGNCISVTPSEQVTGVNGELITMGVKEYLESESEPFKHNPAAYHNYWRKNPIKLEDAFRVSSESSFLDINKLQEQIDYNEGLWDERYQKFRLDWVNGQDSTVKMTPDKRGRFKVSILFPENLTNNIDQRGQNRYPLNKDIGVLGIDPYRISQTAQADGSRGAIHGITIPNAYGITGNKFFLEYVDRPPRVEDFIEDAIKAMVFFGVPALIENNVDNLVRAMKERGYRAFSLDRPDKHPTKLSPQEKEFGGMPSSSSSVKTAEATAIQTYVDEYVGMDSETGHSKEYMPFEFTVKDWMKLDPTKWEKYDASISSSLAIIASKSLVHKTNRKKTSKQFFDSVFKKYKNTGSISEILK